ncbi:MAG: hypothetical protein RLZZ479_840 [Bacteroidota bacterium]
MTNHFDQLDKNEILKLTQSARNNLEQQKQLLNNLLEWAKSQWEGSSFRPEKLDLSKIVNRNVSLLQSTADIKQLTIEIDLLKDATIYADREMIEFVVRNVLHNAIKFSRTLSKIGIKVEKINEIIHFTPFWLIKKPSERMVYIVCSKAILFSFVGLGNIFF